MPSVPKHILIVEDDPGLALLFGDKLRRDGCTCDTVDSARACIAWLETQAPDLMLLDYSLPDLLAPALVEKLREAGRLPPFLVVTGHGDERVAVAMMKLGARDYLVKDNLLFERMPTVVSRTLREVDNERQLAATGEALRESEAFRKRIFESSRVPIVVMDAQTLRYLDCNPAAVEIYRFASHAEVVGRGPLDFSAPVQYDGTPSLEKARCYIERALAEGQVVFEWRHRRPDGELWDAEVHLMSFQSGERRLLQFTLQDITERKRAAAALRESEEKFASAFRNSPISTTIRDLETGRYLEVNERCLALTGHARDEIVGHTAAELGWVTEADRKENLRLLKDQGLVADRELPVRRKDGTTAICLYSAHLIPICGRACVFSTMVDITERKNTDEALRQTQQRFELAQRAAGVGSWEWDLITNQVQWSPELYAMLGLDPARVPATFEAWDRVVQPEDRAPAARRLEQTLKDGTLLESDFRVIHPDSTIHWISVLGRTTYNEQHQPVRLAGICLETTTRKIAEAALLRSEALFRRTFDDAPVGAAIVGLDQTFQRVNAALCRFLGYAAEDLLGRTFAQVTHPDDIVDSVVHVRRLLGGELASFEIEKRYLRQDGGVVWGRVSVSLVRDADGQPLHLAPIIQDITARKRAETELRETRAILQVAMDQSPAGIAIADAPSGALRYVNDAGLLIRGGDRATIVNGVGVEQYVASWKLLDFDGRPLRTDEVPLARAVMFGERCSREFIIHRGDDDDRAVLAKAAPIKDEAGTVVAAVVVFLDVTEQKRAERELEQFFTLVPDMVCIASADGFFRKLNDEWTRVLGYSKDELMAAPFTEFIHPEDRAATRHESAQQAAGNSTASFVNRYRAKDGTYRWFEWNATAATANGLLFAAARDITEHRQAEAAVRESELRYRTLANTGPGLVWTSGLDKKCDYFNQTWLDFTGRSLEQELGDGWVEGVHPEDLERCVATYVTAFGRRERFSMDYRLRHHSGEYRWIQDDGSPRHDSQGNFLGYIGHCLDITERKRADEALRESEEKFAKVFHDAPVWIAITDLETAQYLDVNEAVLRASGFTREEVIGRTAVGIDWITAEARALLVREIRDHGWITDLEMVFQTKDGRTLHGLINGEQITLGGRPCLLTVTIDITERKRAEEELADTRTTLEAAFEQTPIPMVLVSMPDGVLRIVNSATREVLGVMDEPTPAGQRLADFSPTYRDFDAEGRLTPVSEGPLARALRGQRIFNHERRIVTKSGATRWVLASANPIYNDRGDLIAAYLAFPDITERKRAEETLRESLREKEALLKEVHHRVKNNLQVISSLLRLESGRVSDLGTQSVLRDMQNRIRTMALLHESLYRSGNLAEVDLKAYLETLCQQLFRASAARSSGLVDLQVDVGPIRLELNRTVPCGLIVNELVSNCLKHAFPAGHGGRVRVELQPTTVPDEWGLRVSDNGVGLPPGFTLANLPSLGLQLVSDLARQLQGRLEIAPSHGPAAPNAGATFTVYFTALPPESRPAP